MVGAFKADPLRDIGTALDLPALHEDPALPRPTPLQVATRRRCTRIFRERFRTDTTAHWLARLEEQDLLCAPVRTLGEALGDEQTRDQRHDPARRANRVETVRVVGSPDPPVRCRRSRVRDSAGRARPAHRRGAGGARAGARDRKRSLDADPASRSTDHVARVTIDRPEVLNAIDAASERELQEIWATIERDRDVRAVVLTGSGERAFSTGADMKRRQRRQRARILGDAAARRLRRHRAARDARRAGHRPRQRPRGRRRLRDGARLRHRRRRRRSDLRPARGAGRPPAARRRHDAAAAPGAVPSGDGHAPDRQADRGRRSLPDGPRQRGRAARASSTPRSAAGSTTSSPARRSRCARSSRWCAAPLT